MAGKANPGSALGEAVGKLFENAILEGLTADVEARGHSIRPARLKNGSGNVYQIDAVIFDRNDSPIIIVDPKYIRYTKHNRDKGSWLCVAHYNLRKTFPTIRKSIAVLAGRWSNPSKALIRSFGVEVIEVPFDRLVEAFSIVGIDFDWAESDRAGASHAWEQFEKLTAQQRASIATRFTSGIMDQLRADINQVLDTDIASLPRRISEVEVLLKTEQDEMLLLSFNSVTKAMQALANLVSDRPDIGELIQNRPND